MNRRPITIRRGFGAIAAGIGVTLIVAACGAAAGGSNSTQSTSSRHYHFYDSATFLTAHPQAQSIDPTHFSELGPIPHLNSNVKIAVLLKTLTNPYWQAVENGIELGKGRFGVQTSEILSATSENAPEQQLEMCETLLQQGYNAFIIAPETTSNLNPCLQQMEAKNIPNVNIEAPGNGLPVSVYVGPAMLKDGLEAAQYLSQTLPAGSQVAEIGGLPGSSAADLRLQGYEQAVQQSQLKSVSEVAANWDEQTAYSQTLDLMARFPDLKGIYAANDDMAIAVGRAIAQAGKAGTIEVVGTDGTPLGISGIMQGTMQATVTPFPYYEGFWALEAAVRLLGGQNVPEWVQTPDTLITQSNAGQFFQANGAAKLTLFQS